MKIEHRTRWTARERIGAGCLRQSQAGHTVGQLLLTGTLVGLAVAALSSGFATTFCGILTAWQDLRASRLVMEKAESLSLFNRSQVSDAEASGKPVLIEWAQSPGTLCASGGWQDGGYAALAAPAGIDLGPASRRHLQSVTLSVHSRASKSEKPELHTTQVQARLARNGAPKYIWPSF